MEGFNVGAMIAGFSLEKETTPVRNTYSDMLFKRVNGRYYLNVEKEIMEEVLHNICMQNEKNKKIENMSSLQRKLHQRQFAVLHFFLNVIEEFIENISMDQTQKKVLS